MNDDTNMDDIHRAMRAIGAEYSVTQYGRNDPSTKITKRAAYYIVHIWQDARIVAQHATATAHEAHRWARDNYPEYPCENPTAPWSGPSNTHGNYHRWDDRQKASG